VVDINNEVATLLKDIATVQLAFPEINSQFPYVSLTEVTNSSAAVLNGKERYTRYECQIDVWDTTKNGRSPARCVQLAGQICDAMISAGFNRGTGKLMKDPSGLHRYMMQFTGWVDNDQIRVYRGGF
jgi:hypothetical protein